MYINEETCVVGCKPNRHHYACKTDHKRNSDIKMVLTVNSIIARKTLKNIITPGEVYEKITETAFHYTVRGNDGKTTEVSKHLFY